MILTGAGMSSESGLPTFRGKEGYWMKDGENYHPMELATSIAFQKIPSTVWEWYHYRGKVYAEAKPNKGHYAIVELEKYCTEHNKEFLLVTQNVDNLHQKAGSNPAKIFEVHGNIFSMRCELACTDDIYPISEEIIEGVPKCPSCGQNARPHVLWFDEFYNEIYFKYQSAIQRSREIDLLFVIGTTLQTTLPANILGMAYNRSIPIIEINPHPLGLDDYGILVLEGSVGAIFPQIMQELQSSN